MKSLATWEIAVRDLLLEQAKKCQTVDGTGLLLAIKGYIEGRQVYDGCDELYQVADLLASKNSEKTNYDACVKKNKKLREELEEVDSIQEGNREMKEILNSQSEEIEGLLEAKRKLKGTVEMWFRRSEVLEKNDEDLRKIINNRDKEIKVLKRINEELCTQNRELKMEVDVLQLDSTLMKKEEERVLSLNEEVGKLSGFIKTEVEDRLTSLEYKVIELYHGYLKRQATEKSLGEVEEYLESVTCKKKDT